MNPADRARMTAILSHRSDAPEPTREDVRILMTEVFRLEAALDAAITVSVDCIYERLMGEPGTGKWDS